jgi:acyl carrier protein
MPNKNIKKIISIILNVTENEINTSFSMVNCEKWDSLAHVKIILVLENEFNIKFKDDEMSLLIDIKSIEKLVDNHINKSK